MAIHIKDILEAVRIIKETKKVHSKLSSMASTSELHRLSVRIDRFLDDIEEWESIETRK